MKLFYNLMFNPPSLLVTNLSGLLKPFPAPLEIRNSFLRLDKGQVYNRDLLLKVLEEFGYLKEDLVNSHGEYASRGGIVDVFSPWQSYPFRIEFSGDEIASLREFEPASQRSLRKIDTVLTPSLREFPASMQFLEEWERKARDSAEPSLLEDLEKKSELLKKGDFFPSFSYLSLLNRKHFVPFSHYFKDSVFIIDSIEDVERDWKETQKDWRERYEEMRSERKFILSPEEMFPPEIWPQIKEEAVSLGELRPSSSKRSLSFFFQPVPRFENRIPFFLRYLKKIQEGRERCFIYFSNAGKREKLASLLSQHQIYYIESSDPFASPKDGEVILLLGSMDKGFSYPKLKISYFSEKDIFTEEQVLTRRPRVKPFVSQFQDLETGDYVVHTDCGIGMFKGLVRMDVDDKNHEFIEILYRDEDRLFVPVEDLNLVQKYTSLSTKAPDLHKLGTPTWNNIKKRTKKVIETMAKELLNLYAQRKAVTGYSFSPGGDWQDEFEKTFEYEETEDQKSAIKDIYQDMESDYPTDRLLCGDVGYGKTEVGIRASFKAALDGKQVVVLCPTTVLASQHLKTFKNRMVLFPLRVEGLTRLQSKTKQKKIIEDIKKGLVDIVIGTHRILSNDVQFRNLGLLIVDEEQRFGVRHKEKIKEMSVNIDVLTMTATPIPRTLNLSLSGLRDISLIETPPKDRLAIHTVVTTFSRKLVVSAVKAELAREGQVYFIHNRVQDIDSVAEMIKKWVPQAKVITVHGQMPGTRLEKRMISFIQQKYDVLVSTTIIENGIDIPRVNTLIVNKADRFGLAQLYQLRGRVGRSSRQATAYFLVPPFTDLTPLAKERLKALREFSELGSGFRLAAKDLEIRGAGNFLGSRQHGYMEAVGFDYYMYLLEKTVRELKGERQEDRKTQINLSVNIRIPEEFLPQMNLRLNLYKRISSAESVEEIENIKKEINDRYGRLPECVNNLISYGVIKHLARRLNIKSIDRIGKKVIIKFFPDPDVDLARMTEVMKNHGGSITPEGVMSCMLSSEREGKVKELSHM
jgi:transcription-repair coupling factor (superfamily II helicase)